jgi:hypothetical protein
MRMWEISTRVNSPKNDDPSLWQPLHAQPTQRTTDALELLREKASYRCFKLKEPVWCGNRFHANLRDVRHLIPCVLKSHAALPPPTKYDREALPADLEN